MSANAFERKVAKVLAGAPGLWIHHPLDVPSRFKLRLPGDFIYGHAGGWGVLECKETAEKITLPKADWPAHQRATARAVVAAGGAYGLTVRFPDRDLLFLAGGWLSPALGWDMDRVRSDHIMAMRIDRLEQLPRLLMGS